MRAIGFGGHRDSEVHHFGYGAAEATRALCGHSHASSAGNLLYYFGTAFSFFSSNEKGQCVVVWFCRTWFDAPGNCLRTLACSGCYHLLGDLRSFLD